MVYELIREFAVGLTGSDDNATAAWLEARLALDPRWPRAMCATIHFQAAGENDREIIGAYLGFSDPAGGKPEWPLCVQQDYDLLSAMVGELMDI